MDPRYPDAGLPAPGLAQHPVTIKKEPQDFTFDSGERVKVNVDISKKIKAMACPYSGIE